MTREGNLRVVFNLEGFLCAILAALAFVGGSTGMSHATVTSSLGSVVVPSPAISNVLHAWSWFLNQNRPVRLRSNIAFSSASFPSITRSTRTEKTLTYETTRLPFPPSAHVFDVTYVTPSQNRTVTPTATVTFSANRKGLPDGKIVTIVASVLGGILLILTGIITWNLCDVDRFRSRPSARVQPANESVAGSVDQLSTEDQEHSK